MVLDVGDCLQPLVGLGRAAKTGEDFQEGSAWGSGEVTNAILTLRVVEPVRGRLAGAGLRQRERVAVGTPEALGRRADSGQLHELAVQQGSGSAHNVRRGVLSRLIGNHQQR